MLLDHASLAYVLPRYSLVLNTSEYLMSMIVHQDHLLGTASLPLLPSVQHRWVSYVHGCSSLPTRSHAFLLGISPSIISSVSHVHVIHCHHQDHLLWSVSFLRSLLSCWHTCHSATPWCSTPVSEYLIPITVHCRRQDPVRFVRRLTIDHLICEYLMSMLFIIAVKIIYCGQYRSLGLFLS